VAGRIPAPDRWRRVEKLFEGALDTDPAARDAWLAGHCGDDPDLRREVEELLAADQRAPGFLEQGAAAFAAPAWEDDDAEPRSDPTGEQVGPYRVIKEIGRGGMSRVYAAERSDDGLRRRVALKRFAAAGLMREEMRSRFRAEGRALAMLAHPNIAQVFDAGVDQAGEPYIAMELVDGLTIVDYCSHHALDLGRRLGLFLDVCAAVQHAHQHLIVHRDLKPSNILVDGEGRVKLLDFGIAKLLDPAAGGLDEIVAPTRTGLLPMTPEYAAPEQIRGEEITTATDVYALGLLLYELLTGSRAYRVEGRSPAEIERAICDSQPARPSSVVAHAAARQGLPGAPAVDSTRLRRQLAGDLDTIVLKALRKEPAGRYPSVAALADDLCRQRSGLPVTARPASLGYRARKFAGRHRAVVAAATALLAVLLLFGLSTFLQQRETARQRDLARLESEKSQEVTEFLLGLFEASDPSEALGEEVTARQLLERGSERVDQIGDRPAVQARMLDVLGRVYGHLGSHERAEELLRRALAAASQNGQESGLEFAAIQDHLAAVRMQQSDYDEAKQRFRSALAIREHVLGSDAPEVASSLNNLAVAIMESGDPKSAEPLYRRALAIDRAAAGDHDQEIAETLLNLGSLLHDLARYDEAEPLLREARQTFVRVAGPVHPRIADSDNALANLLARLGKFDEAEPLLREAIAQRRKLFGDDHPQVAQGLNDLAVLLENQGRFGQAAPVFREALTTYERLVGPDHLAVAIAASNLAGVEWLSGHFDDAEKLYRRGLDIVVRQLGEENRYAPRRITGIAMALHGKGDREQAETHYRRALVMAEKLFAAGNPSIAFTQLELGRLLVEEGRDREADPLLRSAHESYTQAFGERHARTARSAMWLGLCLAHEGMEEQGRELLGAALAVQRELLPDGHPHLLESERAMAALDAGG